MAGFVKILTDHVYDGAHVAGANGMTNGLFVELNGSGKVIPTSDTKDMDLRVVEKTTLWTKPAVILDVIKHGNNEVYFLENEWEVYNETVDYNTAEYSVDIDHPCRMKRLHNGEQVIVTVASSLYNTLAKGATVHPAANGTIA